jgi:hypothetical protein
VTGGAGWAVVVVDVVEVGVAVVDVVGRAAARRPVPA